MTIESSAAELVQRLNLTTSEVSVARRAAELIRKYRSKGGGAWSGPTADQLVREEVEDPSRQLSILSLACAVEKESREDVDEGTNG